jgi:hypothetical protein
MASAMTHEPNIPKAANETRKKGRAIFMTLKIELCQRTYFASRKATKTLVHSDAITEIITPKIKNSARNIFCLIKSSFGENMLSPSMKIEDMQIAMSVEIKKLEFIFLLGSFARGRNLTREIPIPNPDRVTIRPIADITAVASPTSLAL